MSYFFNWRIILYRILLFSAKPQHELAVSIHISTPFCTSLPNLSPIPFFSVVTEPRLSSESYSKIPSAIYFAYGNESFPVTLSIHLTLFSPLIMSIGLFSMSVSPLLPWRKWQFIRLEKKNLWGPSWRRAFIFFKAPSQNDQFLRRIWINKSKTVRPPNCNREQAWSLPFKEKG